MRKKVRRKEGKNGELGGLGELYTYNGRQSGKKIVQFIEWVNSAFREPAIVTVTTVHSMNETRLLIIVHIEKFLPFA